MSTIEYVDTATAQAARGVRMVVSGLVPSPWSEAAKGLFRVQGVPVRAVRQDRGDAAQAAWFRGHNVPAVLHDDDPPRAVWSEIVALAERLGPPGGLLPPELERRVRVIGLIHELAGEDGLGWSGRLLMIEGSLRSDGARGFPVPVARYLAAKYGHAPERIAGARARIREVLAALQRALADGRYFGGDRPDALDVYSACFLTPLAPLSEADCPAMAAPLRQAFAFAAELAGEDVAPALLEHRGRMLRDHLGWPIAL
jgi:glutathione S-transferase